MLGVYGPKVMDQGAQFLSLPVKHLDLDWYEGLQYQKNLQQLALSKALS